MDDLNRAHKRLMEATGLVNQKKSRSRGASQSMEPLKKLAAGWERFGMWRESCGEWGQAVGAYQEAITLHTKIHQATKDLVFLKAAAQLSLGNARIEKQQNQPQSVLQSATTAASRFQTLEQSGMKLKLDCYLDWAESALLLAELRAPFGKAGIPWPEIASRALNMPREKPGILTDTAKAKLFAMEQRLAGLR